MKNQKALTLILAAAMTVSTMIPAAVLPAFAEAPAAQEEAAEEKTVLFAWEEKGACTMTFYADFTYKFTYDNMGIEEAGTWTVEDDLFKITQSNGVEVTAALGEENTMVLPYVSEISEKLARDFVVSEEVWQKAVNILIMWDVKGACTMTFFRDNTYEFTYDNMGIVENGTWEVADDTVKITQSNGKEAVAAVNEDNQLVLPYVSEISEKLARDFTVNFDAWTNAIQ